MAVSSDAELPLSANNPPFLLPLSESFLQNLLVIMASRDLKDVENGEDL